MRVLLTRAAEDAARTRATLEAAGHQVVVAPVIEIVALAAIWPAGVVDAVLATSANAFSSSEDTGLSNVAFGPTPEARRVMPLFLVGERTAAAARAQGYTGAAMVGPNAAALVVAFDSLARRPCRLAYLAGRDRKPDLENALIGAGQAVEVLEVYEARGVTALSPAAEAAIRAHTVDAVLHYSRRSANLFAELATARGLELTELTHLCLSDDVAAPMRELNFPRVKVAEAPNEAALHAVLDRL